MRIGDKNPEEPEEIPLEVQLWIDRDWTVLPTERLGIVLIGPKKMRGRTKVLIALGVVLVCLFYFSSLWLASGAGFLILAAADYQYATKPPTKFFPAAGEKTRTLDR
ncbi:MAG: hypothetical protein ABI222_18595 [Opitutaceae bacterium]